MIQVLKAMIVREIQEHKVAFVYAPFFVSFILCFVIASVYFGGTSIQTDQFNFSTEYYDCLLYTSPSPRDPKTSRMPSSA